MSKKDFSVALKYVEARPRSQRRKGTEARVSGISVVGSGASATDLSLLQANLISVTNNFTALKDLFDSMFEKDSEGNIHAKLSLWSSGGITAGGVGSGGSGGGGVSYDRLDAWADYSADKAGYVLSALLGKDLDDRVSALANAGYITASYLAPYALRSEIPSLVGYATQSWVGDNFLSKSGGTINGSTTLSIGNLVVSSGDTAVGKIYPRTDNEYTLGQDTRKWKNILCYNINGSTPVNASNLKSTLGISDWALASAKPTYTASEVGALMQDSSITNADLDTILDSKTAVLKPFFQVLTNNNVGSARKGVLRMSYNGSESQLLFDHYNRLLRYRTIGENPKDWATIAFTSNIPTKLSQLTDDVVAGKYLPLSGGRITSDKTTLLALNRQTTQPKEAGIGFEINTEAKGWVGYEIARGVVLYNYSGSHRLGLNDSGVGFIDSNTILHTGNYSALLAGGTINGSITASSFIGNLTGNANSATYILTKLTSGDAFYPDKYKAYIQWVSGDTAVMKFTDGDYQFRANSAAKLATPRTIWGQTFDGTQDITGALTSSSIIKASSFFSTSISIECGAYGVVDPITYGGEINRFGSNIYLQNRGGDIYLSHASGTTYIRGKLKGVGATFTDTLTAPSITIGGATITYDSVNEALCINGNMYALGGITAGGAGISAYTSLEARVARLEQQLNI